MIDLLPGDCLVYKPSNLIGRLIARKTWLPYSHVEVVIDNKVAIGARQEGVNYWPIRIDDALAVVTRPTDPAFKFADGRLWFDLHAKGQKYDVWGLFRFYLLGKPSADKMFCSEMATGFYRNAGMSNLFHKIETDLVPPGWFVTLADGFTEVWRQ
jgi:hypothetical protein